METNATPQEPTRPEQPCKEHEWLQKLIGEWTYKAEASMEPNQAFV